MKRVAIVYGTGAATPAEIISSLDDLADPVFVLPDAEQESDLAEFLSEFATVATFDRVPELEPQGVLTFSDFQMERAAELADLLELPFHSPATAHNMTRKFLQRSILNRHGIGHTATALILDRATAEVAAEQVPLPGVLKPNRGFGGTDTYLVESRAQLLELVEQLIGRSSVTQNEGYVLEELIIGLDMEPPWGNYVSVESVVHAGNISHLGITGKLALAAPFREQGSYLPVRTDGFDEEAVLDMTGKALAALEVGDSICHTEIKITPDGPRIIEVNGRLGHPIFDLFQRAHGVDLIRTAAELALGLQPSLKLDDCQDVVYHYFGLPPVSARELCEIPRTGALRAREEVEHLALLIRAPAPLDWRRGFQERVYTCSGRVRDHAALAGFLHQVDEVLGIRYR